MITNEPTLSYPVCVGVMEAISRSYNEGVPAVAGTPLFVDTDWQLLTGNQCWLGVDRPRVTKMLDDLTQGSLEIVGLPRITISAEHYAAVIAFFVHPTNFQAAASFIERNESLLSHSDLAAGAIDLQTTKVTAEQLLTLVYECYGSDQRSQFQERWIQKTQRALENANPGSAPQPTEN